MIDKRFPKTTVIASTGRDSDTKNFKVTCFAFVFLLFKFPVADSWRRASEITGAEIAFDRLNTCNLLSS